MQVDIYYGELKMQVTEQDQAYDILTFFSKFALETFFYTSLLYHYIAVAVLI
jgi:hypothetical protein